ncbi:hypothetical protein [Bradyrhizobium viridifuturi]|uniref:hypothetical protein n=1 Tax=Bradyrhizobium viridifuturi TaxID=1654716 RepID=UPI000AAD9FD8|nr:hypothetical protein [Bradyrhizobium viridifuturi]
MPVRNAEIAEMFDQTTELLEIMGDNPFRSGKDLAGKIIAIVETHKLDVSYPD